MCKQYDRYQLNIYAFEIKSYRKNSPKTQSYNYISRFLFKNKTILKIFLNKNIFHIRISNNLFKMYEIKLKKKLPVL